MMDAKPLTVSAFLAAINEVLAPQVAWVEGEVADVRVSQGKWLYFDLKDADALVHCFAPVGRVRTPMEDGMAVRLWGVPSVYSRYGKFSITVAAVEPAGEGALRRAYELLKRKLDAEGLFAPERKRALPRFPERIGLITSEGAAAYGDFLTVLRGRRGGMDVLFLGVLVQGREAPAQIEQAVTAMNEDHPTLDALVLVRGGGSMEELHAFNDERVVRAIARSRIPTVVGVGHERDVTLADLVADVRGATPSNAAELLTPTREDMRAELSSHVRRLRAAVADALVARERRVADAVRILRASVADILEHVVTLSHRAAFVGRTFTNALDRRFSAVRQHAGKLRDGMATAVRGARDRLAATERMLGALHPERVLARGFSITRDDRGVVLRDARRAAIGALAHTTLRRGTLTSRIHTIHPWPREANPSTSQGRTRSSRRSSRSSNQATLI